MSEGRRRWTSTQQGRASYSLSMGPCHTFFCCEASSAVWNA